jgi:hypothetical protein
MAGIKRRTLLTMSSSRSKLSEFQLRAFVYSAASAVASAQDLKCNSQMRTYRHLFVGIFICFYLASLGCNHSPKKPPAEPTRLNEYFATLHSIGAASLICRVTFPPMNYLANVLEREKKISREDASVLRDQASTVTAYTDGTPCLIQTKLRPAINDPLSKKAIDHFADVASAATHGTCQMLQLGYLRHPIDFSVAKESWVKEEDGSWSLTTNEGGGQNIHLSADLKRLEIVRAGNPQPFTIFFEEIRGSNDFHLPVKILGSLDEQGAMTYTIKYTTSEWKGRPFPVPLSTQLLIAKEGRNPTKMGLEFSECRLEDGQKRK